MIAIGALLTFMALVPALFILKQRLQELRNQLESLRNELLHSDEYESPYSFTVKPTQAITTYQQRWYVVEPEQLEVNK